MSNSLSQTVNPAHVAPDRIWISEFSIFYKDPSGRDLKHPVTEYVRADGGSVLIDANLLANKNFVAALTLLAEEYHDFSNIFSDQIPMDELQMLAWLKIWYDKLWNEFVQDDDDDVDRVNHFCIRLASVALRFVVQNLDSIVESEDSDTTETA